MENLFGSMDLSVVKFRYDNTDGIDILYTNDKFDEEFDPVEGERQLPHTIGDSNADGLSEAGYANELFEHLTPKGKKKYLCSRIVITEDVRVDIYENVTQKTRQGKYLEVLQRLFRHNLRNDLNVIMGHSNRLIEGLAEDHPLYESAEKIHSQTDELINLCSETKIIRDVIDRPEPVGSVCLAEIIEESVADHRERHPRATINTSVSPPTTVIGNSRLKYLVSSLLSNAIQHNAGDIEVGVELESVEGETELVIRDNGPGIPTPEKKVVTGESEIDSLTHGSGLGLWVVRWIADSNGAEIAFPRPDHDGAEVRVEFQTPTPTASD